ncbi:MAG: choloylglycine hydrolase family protein [Pseudorhodoplanes sp.]|nr:choloylglycine hydrolase family protein [Pseudorhodoplanes sp.]
MAFPRAKDVMASVMAASMLNLGSLPAAACTSMVFKAQDGTAIYARTMEWGATDLKSEMVTVPRGTSFTPALGGGIVGMAWKNAYGYVGINAAGLPYATDGMNEAGLTYGALYYPGFAQYQEPLASEQSISIGSVDMGNYLLGNFKSVEEVRQALPKVRVVRNLEVEKAFGAPVPLHYVVSDATGASIVIEYTGGVLTISDNKVGVMTNAPYYDWHLLNLRNYANLKPMDDRPHDINGVSLAPFGAGSGMLGLPGDFTPPSRFVRATAFVASMLPVKSAAEAVDAASTMLNNFDIPKGLVREGGKADDYVLGFTQWSVIADTRNKVYYYWTMYNRRLRSVDLTKIDFAAKAPAAFPLDNVRAQDIEDRTKDFSPAPATTGEGRRN